MKIILPLIISFILAIIIHLIFMYVMDKKFEIYNYKFKNRVDNFKNRIQTWFSEKLGEIVLE